MRLPILLRNGRGYSIQATETGAALGYIECGPNMVGRDGTGEWGWTTGCGWHVGLPSWGAALDAALADPNLGAL